MGLMKKQQHNFYYRMVFFSGIVWLIIVTALTVYNIHLSSAHTSQIVDLMVHNEEEDRYLRPVVNTSSNTVQLPEMKLALPLNQTTRYLRYDARPGIGVYFSLDWSVGKQSQQSTFPQSCDKMVYLSKEKVDVGEMTFVAELQAPVNGLQYVYEHQQHCFSSADDMNNLVDAVKQIKNY